MTTPRQLTEASKKVLALLLEGRVDDAERFIQQEFTERMSDLSRKMHELGQERALLLNTLQLAKGDSQVAAKTMSDLGSVRAINTARMELIPPRRSVVTG